MAFLTPGELARIPFKNIGRDVLISDRAAIYNPETIEVGDYSRIDDFCCISGTIRIGRNVHIATHCILAGGAPGITMEDFSGLAYGVRVFAQSDDYSGETLTNPTVPACYKNVLQSPVIIGRHVIIGTSSLVFPGVHLADGCSVGALALVNRSTRPWGIYVGNPAKRVKERSQNLLALEEEYRRNLAAS